MLELHLSISVQRVVILIVIMVNVVAPCQITQWKRISRKQSARWQHKSRLKAIALFFLQKNVICMKRNNLYMGLVTPSSG
jgi:hypothetical protein